MKIRVLSLAAILAFALCSCNAYKSVSNTVTVIGQIITVAQDDLPALQTAGLVSPAEFTSISNFLALGQTFDTQATSCVATAQAAGGKNAEFLACFNVFVSGLFSPQELAQLRILNPQAQQKVQIWVTAIMLAVNGIEDVLKAAKTPIPQVADTVPARDELVAFARHANIAWGY